MIKADDIMRNSYSIKYLGLNKEEMGIVSRRINPLADQKFRIHDHIEDSYSIHQYFYPKPLRVGRKEHHPEKIGVENLENEIKKEFDRCRASSNQKGRSNNEE